MKSSIVTVSLFNLLSICSFAQSPPSESSLTQVAHVNYTETEQTLLNQVRGEDPVSDDYISLQFQLADLYMLYQRSDMLGSITDDTRAMVFQRKSKLRIAQWWFYHGTYQYLLGNYAEAENDFAASAQSLSLVNSDSANAEQVAYMANRTSSYRSLNKSYLQRYNDALSDLTEVFKHAEKYDWHNLLARSQMHLGDVSYGLKDYESSLNHYNNALNAFPDDAQMFAAEAQMAIAQMTNVLGEREKALGLLDQAIDTLDQVGHISGLADAYLLKAYFLSKLERDSESLEWIAKSVTAREILGNPINIANAYVHYAATLQANKQLEEAIVYGKKAIDLTEDSQDLAGKWDAYATYAGILYDNGNFEQAYQSMYKAERTLLTKARLDITSENARLNAEFELTREQLHNAYLDEQKSLLEERNKLLQSQLAMQTQEQLQQHRAMLFLVAILGIFIIFVLVIYRLYTKNRQLASIDSLTGLPNRRTVLSFGEQQFSISRRYGYKLSVLMLDIDNFKKINDQKGHEMGDKVLRHVAQICRDSLRTSDFLGRIGGEEFLIILPHTEEDEATNLSERLCKRIMNESSTSLNANINVTASIGLACIEPDSESLSVLVNQADKALYEAKHQGRNQVQIYRNEQSVTA